MNEKIQRRLTGQNAEKLVAAYYIKNGYSLLVSNFFAKIGEIDLILFEKRTRTFVFTEVRSSKGVNPRLRYTIQRAKKQRLKKAIRYFILKNESLMTKYKPALRFDMVWVEGETIDHWKNVDLNLN